MLATYILCIALRALEFGARLPMAFVLALAAVVFTILGLLRALVEWVVGPSYRWESEADAAQREHAELLGHRAPFGIEVYEFPHNTLTHRIGQALVGVACAGAAGFLVGGMRAGWF